MTTVGLRRLRTLRAADALALAAYVAWAAVVLGQWLDLLTLPGPALAQAALLLLVPLGLLALALLRRTPTRNLALVAGATCAVPAALILPGVIAGNPKIALYFPAAAVGGLVTRRFPTATLVAVFALTGTYGSVVAFLGFSAPSVADGMLAALWVGTVATVVFGRRDVRIQPTPALFLLGGFLLLSFIATLTTQPLSYGVIAFRIAPFYMSAALLVGYGGFSQRTLEAFARAILVVSLVVAAYATLRWAIGADPREEALQRNEQSRQYNTLSGTAGVKVQGSFPNGNLLGLWLAVTTPFVVAAAVSWRGGWRLAAIATLPVTTIALFACGQRTATAAIIAGSLMVVMIHMLSRGFRGPRLGVALAVAVTLVGSAAIVYPAVLDNPEKRQRYESLLTPSQDVPFQLRVEKWKDTLRELEGNPFGFGMGAGNPQSVAHRFADVGLRAIDNSYLMVAYDQGIAVMIFFIVALIVLLVELLRFSVWTRGPGGSMLTTAAAGTLTAMLVELMAANYVTGRPMVAGWMIVGLGIAQFGVQRAGGESPPQRPLPYT